MFLIVMLHVHVMSFLNICIHLQVAMVNINKKSVFFHHVAGGMAIVAGYDVERFKRCPTE
jgi:hypothetical protein